MLGSYGYSEIRLPIVEQTPLFKRAIGEVTDVVEKEMYTFEDRNGDSLTLRPEGTAGCVRAGIEHGLLLQPGTAGCGTWARCSATSVRQKGRYRQFHQLGCRAVWPARSGHRRRADHADRTAWWRSVRHFSNHVSPAAELARSERLKRAANYRDALVAYLEQHKEKLDEDCKRRMYTNPLRVLDSKNPEGTGAAQRRTCAGRLIW